MSRRGIITLAALLAAACDAGSELAPANREDAAATAHDAGTTPAGDDAATNDAGFAGAEPTPERDAETAPNPDAAEPRDAEPGDAVAPPSACPAPGLSAGDHEFTLQHDGRMRRYDLHVPANYDPQTAIPLVLYFHPLLTDRDYLQRVGTPEKADAENYLAAYADGVRNSWNAGACCGPANGVGIGADEIDDVGFVRAMVAEIAAITCVDPQRIYAAGFSNGGFLSHRLACEASDLIAAIAAVSAANGLDPAACAPARPVPILAINGTNDGLVPYEGGGAVFGVTDGPFRSVAEVSSEWAARNQCSGPPIAHPPTGDVTCETYDTCAGGVEVTQCTVTGGGHCWYGEPICALGRNNRDLPATDATWEFLSRFRLP